MGSWNYYIEIKIDGQTLNRMISEYKQHQTYQEVFYFGKSEDGCSEGYSAEIISIIDNFLPANHLIYNFLSKYHSYGLCIKTNDIERTFDFIQKSDFIKFMYDIWENKIDFVYDQLGVIAIKYKQYHKIRSKLYKKYYTRVPKPTKRYNDNGDKGNCNL